jgi:hypothetical protein
VRNERVSGHRQMLHFIVDGQTDCENCSIDLVFREVMAFQALFVPCCATMPIVAR